MYSMHNKLMIIHAVAVLLSVRLAAFRIVDRRSILRPTQINPPGTRSIHRKPSQRQRTCARAAPYPAETSTCEQASDARAGGK